MNISVRWLNQYVNPANASADEIEASLMSVGFPTESRADVGAAPGEAADTRMDVEITSNRGDCLSHIGLARELAAKTGRTLVLPMPSTAGAAGLEASSLLSLTNQEPSGCPLFTARVITGVKVGPSPAWLRRHLEAVGQRSINNVVDVTNFINFEFGNPCHVFDLKKLAGASLIVRFAKDKEPLTTLDGKKRTLRSDEMVVADAQRAQSLAGVIGGADSEVSAETTDVVLEMATWEPAVVRRAARRHGVRTDASHRFERLVDARTIDAAAARAAALIVEVAGGRECRGVLTAGAPLSQAHQVRLRPHRCRALLGIEVSREEMVSILGAVEVSCGPLGRSADELVCTVPAHRPDLTREADLVEEVARIKGMDAIPINEKIAVEVRPPQPDETARRELLALLTGLGFYETVTFSFTSPKEAGPFLPKGLAPIQIDDERRGGEPSLRPSVLTGLLTCRRHNQHANVHAEGGVRLFETAAVFAESPAAGKGGEARTIENNNLGMLMDIPVRGKTAATSDLQAGARAMRGVVEALVRLMAGATADLAIKPSAPHATAFDGRAFAQVSLSGRPLGYLGIIEKATQAAYDLSLPVVACELNLPALLREYPPKSTVAELPAFPAIERDISVVVGEPVAWETIAATVQKSQRPPLEKVSFVGTYRGAQLGKGKKSVTLRLRFRDPARTLRHEEVEAPVAEVIGVLGRELNAELRA